VVILPAALAEEVARDALEQEFREEWALERVRTGESIRGVYPLSDARAEDYARWRETRAQEQPR
jgi:5-oxopent-3-ene-1,2,5-tricarboxylate decarboxylase / 2-hydroxyhepta-2,4-diene-1,7-dioate isomerase